ncbi:C-type lectin domain family 4 member M-like [Asterias rubens]|uniref:C-type lectin domain family 4 member M-like n=1 Tax=Asterias rubens TaxID=7604 RepID=UPI0014550E38|nr:C-type lectin domain family 4 member M-like [Asterias rubens]
MPGAGVALKEGKQICVELGGAMVVPQSTKELQTILNMCSCSSFWIDCNDIQEEGTWVCSDGEGTIDKQDKRWMNGQPDSNNGNEDCAVGRIAGWHNWGCGTTHKLICQRPVRAL